MRGRNVADIAAELKALVAGIEVNPYDADSLQALSHVAMRVMDLAQTLADEANQASLALMFPPEAEE